MITQPSNRTLNTKDLTANLEWDMSLALRMNHALHQAQIAIDGDAQAFSMKYTRVQTGVARDSIFLHTVLGSGMIIQETPYIRKIYYEGGAVNLSVNPFSRRRWFESVIANHKEDILTHAQSVLNREFQS